MCLRVCCVTVREGAEKGVIHICREKESDEGNDGESEREKRGIIEMPYE